MSPLAGAPALDHLVVMADTLEAGAAWCERVLGVPAAPGGRHAQFGTHNRVLAIGSAACPLAYLEIIARDPEAVEPGDGLRRRRWFDMDDARLRARIRAHGPHLIHWVARVPDVEAAAAQWAGLGIDRGEVLDASRMTPHGVLRWRITVRSDGQRLMGGCLPTLIQWDAVHPASTMPASGVALAGLRLVHPQAALLRRALDAVGLPRVEVEAAPTAGLYAELHTPRGRVLLESAVAGELGDAGEHAP